MEYYWQIAQSTKNTTTSVSTKDLAIPLLPCIWHVYEDEHGVLSLFAVGNTKYNVSIKMTSRLLEQMIMWVKSGANERWYVTAVQILIKISCILAQQELHFLLMPFLSYCISFTCEVINILFFLLLLVHFNVFILLIRHTSGQTFLFFLWLNVCMPMRILY